MTKERKEIILVEKINSSLTSTVDVSQANIIKANSNYAFKGVQPTGKGFIIKSYYKENIILNSTDGEFHGGASLYLEKYNKYLEFNFYNVFLVIISI